MTDPLDTQAYHKPAANPPDSASGFAGQVAHSDALTSVRVLWLFSQPPNLDDVLSPAVLGSESAASEPADTTGAAPVVQLPGSTLLADVLAEDIEQRRKRGLPCGISVYAAFWGRILRSGPARRAVLAGEFLSQRAHDTAIAGDATEQANQTELIRRDLIVRYPALQPDIDAVATIASVLDQGTLPDAAVHLSGDRLGKYRLDAVLGAGSFGQTWLAWDEALRRHVALKILRHTDRGADDAALRRVLAEASAAAGLDHPAIVRVHEAGQFGDSGDAYIDAQFVGRVVAGQQPGTFAGIAQTAEDLVLAGPLPPSRAARLVGQIAGAVAAAHARGITHRDIKPSNILLAPTGEPLLADFGLASIDSPADQPAMDASTAPRARPRIAGTLAYLAPEVARGEPATPLSDVFSLGCTLRVLLQGAAPRRALHANNPANIPPNKPDTDPHAIEPFAQMLARAGREPLPALSADGSTIPRALAQIANRATAHEPAHRYTSADRLAADLQAFLDHRPVEADPIGPIGLITLWVRRHRTGVLTAAAVLLLVGFATVAFVQGLRAERNRAVEAERIAEARRDEALAANETIMLMNRFVARTFNSTRGQRESADFTVKEAIRLGASRLVRTYADRPLAAAAVQHFLGQAAAGAGDFETARTQLAAALETRRLLLGATHPDTIATLRQTGEMLSVSGKRPEADAVFAEVVKLLGEPAAMRSPDGLYALARVGAATLTGGDSAEARRVLEAVEPIYASRPHDGSADHQHVMNYLVTLYGRIREPLLAVAMQQRIVELNTRLLGDDDISTLNALQALGSVLRAADKTAEARATYREALRRYVRTVGEGHGYTMHVRLELASLALPADPAEAIGLLDAVEAHAAALGPGHISQLKLGLLRGQALDAAGRSEQAVAALRQALGSALKAVGPANRWTQSTASTLATILDRQGRKQEAAAVRQSVAKKPADGPED